MTTAAQERVNRATGKQKTALAVIGETMTSDKAVAFIKGLAPRLDARALLNAAYVQVQMDPKLRECEPKSILRSVAEAAKLGLTIDGVLGHAYLVPFKDRRADKTIATMMIGYRGMAQLAYRSDRVARIHADTICANDEYEYVEGVAPVFRHRRTLSDRGELKGVYAIAHPAAGGPPWIVVLGVDEVEKRREASASYKFDPRKSPWTTHRDAMFKKTALRELDKLLPTEAQAAALMDEALDEGRMEPGTLDLGEADVLEDAAIAEAQRDPSACSECGRVNGEHDADCSRPGAGPGGAI